MEYMFKVMVVGDMGTGKTSIIKRSVHNVFSHEYKSTIGVDFALKCIRLGGEETARVQLWDIAGQERFGNMTRVYYREAKGAFIVFDATRLATFDTVVKWKEDIENKLDEKIPLILLANKSDMEHQQVSTEEIKKLGFNAWFETSAKTGEGIDQALCFLVQKMIKNNKGEEEEVVVESIKLDEKEKKQNKKEGCC